MKIGILTFHNIPNFGAILQAYALCKALRHMGHECEIINYRCDNIVARELTYHPHPNIIKNIILRHFIWPTTEKKIKACQNFILQNNMYSKNSFDRRSISNANNNYDAFLSGSDMIWDFSVTNKDTTYLLDFVNDEKLRYSYGSSCGDEIWDEKDMDKVLPLLNHYQGVAVREEQMLKKLQMLGVESTFVADPTLLLTPQHWTEVANRPKDKDYVLVYFPSDINLAAASKYARDNKKEVIVLNWGLPIRKYKNVRPYSPQEWVGYIKSADAVFTNSYHGLWLAKGVAALHP